MTSLDKNRQEPEKTSRETVKKEEKHIEAVVGGIE